VKTDRLNLIPHRPKDLLALLESAEEYEKSAGMNAAPGIRDYLLAASPEYLAALRSATAPDPWKFGFAIFHAIDKVVMGFCGFTGPPDADGVVEIAYGIAPSHQRRGYATEAAGALVQFASRDARVTAIRAHTLPETSSSTRVLEKCGFKRVGEISDPEDNPVWRWERPQ
jgi:RimJ/RimL family protein N-acetyltransferase